MKYTVSPSLYKGTVAAPPSKSYLQRALMLAAFAKGESTIKGYQPNGDTEVIINAIAEMGAGVEVINDIIKVKGTKIHDKEMLFCCNESGLAARILSALSLLTDKKVTITGNGTLMVRPMTMVGETLLHFGKKVNSINDCLPLEITGNPVPGEIITDASQTSQLLTGLLISLPFARFNSVLNVNNLKSRPYVELTLELIKKFGIEIKNEDFKRFEIKGNQFSRSVDVVCEGDWSGAAFHLVAAAIASDVTVTGINADSRQADRVIADVLMMCGAECTFVENGLRVKKDKLLPFDFDAGNCPDLFPPLAVLAAHCNGVSRIGGVGRLFFKESNRAESIMEEFRKLGISVSFNDETMIVTGSKVFGTNVSSHNDHRIAMALAIMGLDSETPVTIDGMECIRKSYPGFIRDLEGLCR
jgi:3-phosphoshikimate 1-carboxyvinyltransferase